MIKSAEQTPGLSVQEFVRTVHAQVRDEHLNENNRNPRARDFARLREAFDQVYRMRNLVGRMPPRPNTLRARAGAVLVRMVQRLLFWYTPQIARFHSAVTSLLDAFCSTLERQSGLLKSFQADLAQLRREIRLPKGLVVSELKIDVTPPRTVSPSLASHAGQDFSAFYFALQDRFRGPEEDIRKKLGTYLDVLAGLDPQVRRERLVDLGSGRGEWLEMAAEAGYDALGVDASPLAVAFCRDRNLQVQQKEALAFLREQPNESIGIVTCFHVLEHCPFEHILMLVKEVVRTLVSGGVLILETPHPGNLSMAARDFWLDPSHLRPLPTELTEFVLEHFGLRVLRRMELNPHPQELHLPFQELGFMKRLDGELHGPQDYGLIAQR
jgi:O-antigen chain-terminating methyltransferase